MITNAGEDVEYFSLIGLREANAICGKQGQLQFSRDRDGGLIAGFFFAAMMALKLDVDVFAAECTTQFFDAVQAALAAACSQCMSEQAFVAACEADQAAAHLRNFLR